MIKEYTTAGREASVEYEIKRSRFIASLKPVETEEKARDFIEGMRELYRDASHNVYAYDITGDTRIQRYSDDGEPQGTAGLPVMMVVKKNNVRNVVIVVTRYFGGTLLGASGLARAYGKSASGCIQVAGTVRRILCILYNISVGYQYLGRLQATLAESEFSVRNIRYTENVALDVAVPIDKKASFTGMIKGLTSGSAAVSAGNHEWINMAESVTSTGGG